MTDKVPADAHHQFKFGRTPFGIEWWKNQDGVWNMKLFYRVTTKDPNHISSYLNGCLPDGIMSRSFLDVNMFMRDVNSLSMSGDGMPLADLQELSTPIS